MRVEPSTRMPSRFRVPIRRKQIAARVPEAMAAKLEALVKLWKMKAGAEGKRQEEIDDINQSWVIEVLLGDAIDSELQQFGGLPKDDDGWKAMEKSIRLSHKQ